MIFTFKFYIDKAKTTKSQTQKDGAEGEIEDAHSAGGGSSSFLPDRGLHSSEIYHNPDCIILLCFVTPSGLKKIREEELKSTRGNGKGERRSFERIYDCDVYNDLGDPDSSKDLKRPVLGGALHPYPRRCRTGRDPTHADPLLEKRSLNLYVPRDEAFSEAKLTQFSGTALSLGLDALTQSVESLLVDLSSEGFRSFSEIDKLFKDETKMSVLEEQGTLQAMIRKLFNYASDAKQVLRFPTAEAYNSKTDQLNSFITK